jgi:hypothetical protein
MLIEEPTQPASQKFKRKGELTSKRHAAQPLRRRDTSPDETSTKRRKREDLLNDSLLQFRTDVAPATEISSDDNDEADALRWLNPSYRQERQSALLHSSSTPTAAPARDTRLATKKKEGRSLIVLLFPIRNHPAVSVLNLDDDDDGEAIVIGDDDADEESDDSSSEEEDVKPRASAKARPMKPQPSPQKPRTSHGPRIVLAVESYRYQLRPNGQSK